MPDGKYLIGESLREKLKSTIAKVDSIPFGGPVSRIPTALEGDSGGVSPKVFRVCTATGAWPVSSSKAVKFYGVETTPNTVSVLNKIVSLPAPASTNTSRIVNIAKDGTQWYLVSFQMSAKTAVMATDTKTITFINSANTQTLTYAGAGPEKTLTYVSSVSELEIVTGVSATLNSANCSISVTTAKTRIKTASGTQTTTFKTAGSSQTATIVSMSGTETVTIITGTYTATFISLEI